MRPNSARNGGRLDLDNMIRDVDYALSSVAENHNLSAKFVREEYIRRCLVIGSPAYDNTPPCASSHKTDQLQSIRCQAKAFNSVPAKGGGTTKKAAVQRQLAVPNRRFPPSSTSTKSTGFWHFANTSSIHPSIQSPAQTLNEASTTTPVEVSKPAHVETGSPAPLKSELNPECQNLNQKQNEAKPKPAIIRVPQPDPIQVPNLADTPIAVSRDTSSATTSKAYYTCDIEAALNGGSFEEDGEDTDVSTKRKGDRSLMKGSAACVSTFKPTNDCRQPLACAVGVRFARQSCPWVVWTDDDAPGGLTKVTITHFQSLSEFWVRTVKAAADTFTGNIAYQMSPVSMCAISVGQPCMFASSKTPLKNWDSWQRGRIEKIDRRSKTVNIRLVDCGQLVEGADLGQVHTMPKAYSAVAPLAYHCAITTSRTDYYQAYTSYEDASCGSSYTPCADTKKKPVLAVGDVMEVRFDAPTDAQKMPDHRDDDLVWHVSQILINAKDLLVVLNERKALKGGSGRIIVNAAAASIHISKRAGSRCSPLVGPSKSTALVPEWAPISPILPIDDNKKNVSPMDVSEQQHQKNADTNESKTDVIDSVSSLLPSTSATAHGSTNDSGSLKGVSTAEVKPHPTTIYEEDEADDEDLDVLEAGLDQLNLDAFDLTAIDAATQSLLKSSMVAQWVNNAQAVVSPDSTQSEDKEHWYQ